MAQVGLYRTPDYSQKAQRHYGQALQGYGAAAQQPREREKSIGGAMQSAGSMGATGYMLGAASAGGVTGPVGAAIGGGVGLGAYLLS